ncbi:MAG TPA: type I polyketide synthase, partial [Solirubrobacteraceae bacterium]|nr:type I polyketide synthase [Solirubrobacteraceae bacterium]
ALLATYGQEHEQGRPLWLGSIKSNIGHPQAAAGVAGLIKAVQALRNATMPKTLHVDVPSPQVDWGEGAVALLTEARPWPRNGAPRRVGVSSFGVSGTNVHTILEEAPAEGTDNETGGDAQNRTRGALAWPLSARGPDALRAQATRLLEWIDEYPQAHPADVALALVRGRSALEDRAVIVGDGHAGLRVGLEALARETGAAGVVRGRTRGDAPVAFLFTGQGAQRVGMGRELYESQPLFRHALEETWSHFDGLLEGSLRAVMFGEQAPGALSPPATSLDATQFTQAALFALEVALFRLLEGWDVRPDYLLGHSIGELAAAHVAGVLSLPDACRLVAARGRLMGALPAGGAMIAVQASEQEAVAALAEHGGAVVLAAVNGPAAVVLSGELDAVAATAQMWAQRGRKTRRLRVSHAFHSPRMDAMLGELETVARELTFAAPKIPIVSNVSGESLSAGELAEPGYWARQARAPVRFCDGVRWLARQGVENFLELGPDGVLSAMCPECLAPDRPAPMAVPLLRGERPEQPALLAALAQAWVGGVELNWSRPLDGSGVRPANLPTYPFQRRRHWLQASAARPGNLAAVGIDTAEHPLLGATVALAANEAQLFTGRLSVLGNGWLGDHYVMGRLLVPGTTFVEAALSAGERVGCPTLRDLVMEVPLLLSESEDALLQVVLDAPGVSGERTVSIYSQPADAQPQDDAGWTRHAHGVLAAAASGSATPDGQSPAMQGPAGEVDELGAEAWPPAGAEPVAAQELYDALAGLGVEYGPAFTGVRALWRRGDDVFAEVRLPEEEQPVAARFGVHPALLDACLQTSVARTLAGDGSALQSLMIPFAWNGVRLSAAGTSAVRVHARVLRSGEIAVRVADTHGRPVIAIDSLVLRPVSREQLQRAARGRHDSLFTLEWVPVASPERPVEHGCELLDCAELLAAPDAAASSDDPQPASAARTAELAHALAHRALGLLQQRLVDEHPPASPLVLLTRGAVAVAPGEPVT